MRLPTTLTKEVDQHCIEKLIINSCNKSRWLMKKCEARNCILADRQINISSFIQNEISILLRKLERENDDAHPDCLHLLVRNELDYQADKIFFELMEKHPQLLKKGDRE